MIKMIIADDEPIILKGLSQLVDWHALGIDVVGLYENGEEAYKGILKQKPDIALMDISMPDKTGLDIMKDVVQLKLDTKFVFISGFEEFKYAHKALKLGAVDYFLKPVSERQLIKTIEGITNINRDEIMLDDAINYHTLIMKNQQVFQVLRCQPADYYSKDKYQRKLMMFSMMSGVESYLRNHGYGMVAPESNDCVYIAGADESELKYIIDKLMENQGDMQILYSSPVNSISFLSEYVDNLLVADDFYFMPIGESLAKELIYWVANDLSRLEEVQEALLEAIKTSNDKKRKWATDKLFLIVSKLSGSLRENACLHLYNTYKLLVKSQLVNGTFDLTDVLIKCRAYEHYSELTCYIEALITDFAKKFVEQLTGSQHKEIIKAKEYMNTYFAEHITLESLAAHVHMNPYYFSSYFKKHTGVNYKNYLDEVRMKAALDKIVKGVLTNREIALSVGFIDVKCFAKHFKKYYGETPASYKRRISKKNSKTT